MIKSKSLPEVVLPIYGVATQLMHEVATFSISEVFFADEEFEINIKIEEFKRKLINLTAKLCNECKSKNQKQNLI